MPLKTEIEKQAAGESKKADPAQARYEFACKARELELTLFWQRSLFFWGFIAASFVAFAQLRQSVGQSCLVATFGFVCSFVWTLANRGSKFWYEKLGTEAAEF